MTAYQFKQMLKERFIFVYSCPMMNFLRHHGVRYLCKGKHEVTDNPFWLFDRTDELCELLSKYKEMQSHSNETLDIPGLDEI